MRGLLLVTVLFSQLAAAGKITMTDPDESTTDNGKTFCTYENSQYTFTYVTKAQTCPFAKTFDTDNAN